MSQRKADHVRIAAEEAAADRSAGAFAALRLDHRALPELDLDEVDPSCEFLGHRLSFPFMMASMTGGADGQLRRINRNLAAAARRERVAMAVGSQRVMFSDPQARAAFDLRPLAPEVPLIANLGAVQLRQGMGIEECRAAVDVLAADGLYLHLNPLQEAVQREGTPTFGGLASRIGAVAEALDRPVLVKEVGAGLHPDDLRALIPAGVRYFDAAGAGGTSWSYVESRRGDDAERRARAAAFADWGVPAPQALRRLSPLRSEGATLIGSGGIRSGVDIARAMILGASLGSAARPLLAPAMESEDAVCAVIRRYREEFRLALFLLGCRRPEYLIGQEQWIVGDGEYEAGPRGGIHPA
ncbi:type 2 isopentenyl-diphosphate Delta-isomerase [Kiritimatiella glycovorans]|nr:type 2 isopentenyl-diphosphate Delta-isomerase [Kiritimatiella glycovorans]